MQTIKMTLLSDYACPFCYVGKAIVKKINEEKKYFLDVNWVPFELHQDTPQEGVKRGKSPEMDQMLEGLNKAAEGLGIEFNPFDKMPNTRLALEASEFARDQGKLDEFQGLLYKALFTKNEDIGQLDLILSYAKEVGLDTDELSKALDDKRYAPRIKAGRELGEKHKIELIPTFLLNEDDKIFGVLTYDSFLSALEDIQKGISPESGEKKKAESTSENPEDACGPEGCRIF